MNGSSIIGSVDRIEAALARIETALGQGRTVPVDAAGDGDLEVRHEALKASVADALARIDALIASASLAQEDEA